MRFGCCLYLVALTLVGQLLAQDKPTPIDARMMRFPDVSATQIAFVYAGDIWVAPKTGGVATRLSSPQGEETFPRFSPDGAWIAFSGNYDGNTDLYIIPATGGIPRRITHHGASDRLIDWYPDGKRLLFATSMTSYKDRFNQLYQVSVEGGLPEKLPMPYGEFGSIKADGKTLAYTPISVDFRTWKRYRGGMNPDIWIFDLETFDSRNITRSDSDDSIPMWHGDTLYFLSDRDAAKRANLWAWDSKTDQFRALTKFTEQDIHFPSIGPSEIVFEHAGQLLLLDLQSEQTREVHIEVVTDQATLKPRDANVSGLIQQGTVSPTGKRVLFEARGDLFSAPAEQGVVRNLTRSSGVAERFPAWSPDGKLIAYFSDRSSEYELTVRAADGTGTETNLTQLGPGFRYQPQWSPDSKKVAFIDQAMRIHLLDAVARTNAVIGRQLWMYHGGLAAFRVAWSPDSRWISWAQDQTNQQSAIVLFDTKEGKTHPVTTGFYNDDQPAFDPDGKYLYFRTTRGFTPSYSDLDNTWIYANGGRLALITLKRDTPSPLAPKNDEEERGREKKKDDAAGNTNAVPSTNLVAGVTNAVPTNTVVALTDSAATNAPGATNAVATTDASKEKDKDTPKPVEIDLGDFEPRIVLLPPGAGQYDTLIPLAGGKLIYRRQPRTASDGGDSALLIYDLDKREEKTVLGNCGGAELSADRNKLLVVTDGKWAVVEPKEGQKLEKLVPTGGLTVRFEPLAEWRQIFNDVWRFQRDYFYDPGLHGVDWNLMKQRYGRLLDSAVTRWDVNYVIGELIGELNSSHTYRSGGDLENPPSRGVGYLGCDFRLTNGVYQIARIIEGASWDVEPRSPLKEPGVNVNVGDYLLAVNGDPLDPNQDPWAAFQGLADMPVLLSISTNGTPAGARDVLVKTLDSEARLRHLAWQDANRRRVLEKSGGRVAYVYVPDTGQNGQNELVRQWRGQVHLPGMVVDERFNSGGQIPDRFVELLDRPLRNWWGVRDGHDWPWPPAAQQGPKAMLMNGWSGSGGDCFPYYFKQSGLGPLIGQRTWGGLIGITGAPGLVDGGSVTVPTFGIFNLQGDWIIEGYGVDPDIEVVDDPSIMARGGEPQLDRAIEEIVKALARNPPPEPRRPAYPDRRGI
ncbi:MAG TPA: PDZ domain-containing protein [Verrucomicrobiota bacterium]|nr:PDZ domain-containing protein [Verrucomicrobiota bacterium]